MISDGLNDSVLMGFQGMKPVADLAFKNKTFDTMGNRYLTSGVKVPMTSLFVTSEKTTLPIDLSALMTTRQMSSEQFYEFCRTNPELRIERNANGEITVMSPAFSDTGNRNLKISQQVANWADEDGTGEAFDSSAGFTLSNGATRSPDTAWIQSERWNALRDVRSNKAPIKSLILKALRNLIGMLFGGESLTPEEQTSFAPIVPDFVIELRSSSDLLSTLRTCLKSCPVQCRAIVTRQL
jgi:Uma2 family endonuclease